MQTSPTNGNGPSELPAGSAHNNSAELVIVGRVLLIMASRVSENLATFSSWLIVSYAALLALLISNVDKLEKYLPAKVLGTSALWFLVAVAFHVLQKYLAAVVAGTAAVTKDLADLPPLEIKNPQVITSEIVKATLWPVRLLVQRSTAKIDDGDLAHSGRSMGRLAQIQAYIVFFQVVGILWSGYLVARAL